MSDDLLSLYQEGKKRTDAKAFDEGVDLWRQAAEAARRTDEWSLAAFFFFAIGKSSTEAERGEDDHRAYGEALASVRRLGRTSLEARILEAHGQAFEKQNDLKEAEGLYQEALGLREELLDQSLRTAWSLWRLGQLANKRFDFKAAK